ncbi:MAG: hypothetical protein QOG59_2747, partial [Solirubrobacteraceae bacterium]|nr:hypothetical protein [Solirubrobacteraceae bacterium]
MIGADLPESGETPLSHEALVVEASFAQQRMWFLDRLDAGRGTYNVPFLTRLRGPLNGGALELALQALVDRHESLRTVFALVDGVPHQVIKPVARATLNQIDLSEEPDAEPRGLQLIADLARERFDLESELPLRAALVKLGDQDHLLAVTLHHIVTDGWSMGVLTRELSELYGAFVAGRAAELPELPIQYADYAAWQQEWMRSGGLEQQLEYWKRTLAGAPSLLELPTDMPRRAEQSFRGATLEETFPRKTLDDVQALGDGEGATLFMTLLAAFTVLLSRYSGQRDIVVGTPVANRSRAELERLIGLLVNTLALRIDVSDNPTFRELVRRVRELSLDAFSNQDVPFEKLIAELNPERSSGHAPVTQVLFALQGS